MEEVQARLQKELRQTMHRLKEIGVAIAIDEFPGGIGHNAYLADAGDESQVNERREISWATRSLLAERANKLAKALERLRRGEYGLCEECGESIAPARLKVMPEVATCVRCQDRIEQEMRRSAMIEPALAADEDEE